MNQSAIKDVLYGGLTALMKHPQYYRHSMVGKEYCKWSEEGTKALLEYMNFMCAEIAEIEEAELDKRAKQLVINGLKGDVV